MSEWVATCITGKDMKKLRRQARELSRQLNKMFIAWRFRIYIHRACL